MLRRLLARRAASKAEKNQQVVSDGEDKTDTLSSNDNNDDNNNTSNMYIISNDTNVNSSDVTVPETPIGKEKIDKCYQEVLIHKDDIIDTSNRDEKQDDESEKSSPPEKEPGDVIINDGNHVESKENKDLEDFEYNEKKIVDEQREEIILINDKGKLSEEDEEKDAASVSHESETESISDLSEVSGPSVQSDQEEKDSGIEKGNDSPIPPHDDEKTPEDIDTQSTKSTDYNLDLPTTTLQVLSPINFKSRRFLRRTKSERRPKGITKDLDIDSEQSCDSSPEKRPRGRKSITISYLNFPQRLVRSSLAVEARLSQWHREVSTIHGIGVVGAPSPVRKGILKQTEENTTKNAKCRRQNSVRVQRKGQYDSSDSGLSDGDDEPIRMPVRKIYSNKSALRQKIADLEGMLQTMAQQRRELEQVVEMLQCWSADLRKVERTKLGVPYIRSVKTILRKQRQSMNEKRGEFSQLVTSLKYAKIPCIDDVIKLVQQLRKEVSMIVQDKRRYSAKNIENIRHLQGRVTGICNAILAVYYVE